MPDISGPSEYYNLAGSTPKGTLTALPIGGNINTATSVLGINGTWSSGWLDTSKYAGAETTLFSDQDGSYTISYSQDAGGTLSLPIVNVPYMASQGTRKGQFPVSATWVKFDYTNGSTVQTKFLFKIDLLTQPAQTSAETLNATGSDSRTAQWTKTRIETKTSDITNDYAPIYRTANSLNVSVTNQPATQPISGTVTANQGTSPWVTRGDRAPTSSTTTVNVLATTTTVLAVNVNRKGATIWAEGILYLLLGSGASQTNYSIKMSTGSYYEVPFSYTGIITAVGAGVVVRVTELT